MHRQVRRGNVLNPLYTFPALEDNLNFKNILQQINFQNWQDLIIAAFKRTPWMIFLFFSFFFFILCTGTICQLSSRALRTSIRNIWAQKRDLYIEPWFFSAKAKKKTRNLTSKFEEAGCYPDHIDCFWKVRDMKQDRQTSLYGAIKTAWI